MAALPKRKEPLVPNAEVVSWAQIGLEAMEKRKILLLPGIKPQPSSPSLYRLSYPESSK
jgi:hypothetical protein